MERKELIGKSGHKICVHNRRKSDCAKCKGSSICIHGRRGRICKECMGIGICEHKRQKYACTLCLGVPRLPRSRKRKRLVGESFEDAIIRWENDERWDPAMAQDRERILDAFDFEVSQCLKTFYTNWSFKSFQTPIYVFKRDYTQLFDINELSVRAKETFASPFQRVRSLASQVFSRFPLYMRHIFWQYLLGTEQTSLLSLDGSNINKVKKTAVGAITKQIKSINKSVADVGILFKEDRKLQMVIPDYNVELKSKYGSSSLARSWHKSFLHGDPSSSGNVLRESIDRIEAKNKYSITYVCESLSLQLPLSNNCPHSLVLQVQRLSNAGKSISNVGIIVVPNDADVNYLIYWCGVLFIDGFKDRWCDDVPQDCHAVLSVEDDECSRRVYDTLTARCVVDYLSNEKRNEFVNEWGRINDQKYQKMNNCNASDTSLSSSSSSSSSLSSPSEEDEDWERSGKLYDVFDGFREMRFVGFRIDSFNYLYADQNHGDRAHIRGSFRKLCRSVDLQDVSFDGAKLSEVECLADRIAICDAIPTLEETLLLPMKDVPSSNRRTNRCCSRYSAKLRYELWGIRHMFQVTAISRSEQLPVSQCPIVKKKMSDSIANSQIWYTNFNVQ